MPQQVTTVVENNFTKGLITESTGLNFPENAATDTDNCTYSLIGDVTRRLGINKEINGSSIGVPRTNLAQSDYKWDNAGGDGLTQLVVHQNGRGLYFFASSSATVASPLSTKFLASSQIDLSAYTVIGSSFDETLEAQFADGSGYLFIYHPSINPVYCTYASGIITATPITINIRDFTGIVEPIGINSRPSVLTIEHQYNLTNQGWTRGAAWDVLSSSSVVPGNGSKTFVVPSGLSVTLGDFVNVKNYTNAFPGGIFVARGTIIMSGSVTAYSGTSMTLNVVSFNPVFGSSPWNDWELIPTSTGYIDSWKTAVGNYPSNADVWWRFKNASNSFDPATTVSNVTLNTGRSPTGHNFLSAFTQQRSLQSGISGLSDVVTTKRPSNGAWFQGRVWFTGINAQQPATGDAAYYTWTENIYFSQTISGNLNFGDCFQVNDPTSENLFDLLPTDGGVITIQGSGNIFKLFPIQNGLLVFAANGVWFITGSQGIGFAANDYTVTKISAVQSISSTSFVNVTGLPYFWNEEGIYTVAPTQGGGLEVNPITIGTILSFYNSIPVSCKKFARGAYHPLDYVIQWVYRDSEPSNVTTRYSFNRILNFNTYNKAFFPYSVDNTTSNINGILYVSYPGGNTAPEPAFKYSSSTSSSSLTYADEHDESFVDWGNINYISFFVTGYKLRGQAIKKFQPQYIQMYSRTNDAASAYKIQGIWDFANDPNSGRYSSVQLVTNGLTRYNTVFRRHKIRGHGFALQFKIISVDGSPFDIQGWAVQDTTNQGT